MKNIKLQKKFESSAGEVAYDSFGSGPDVVLVHGTPTNSSIWYNTLQCLQGHYRVHLFDLPGYGKSDQYEAQDVRLRSFGKTLSELCEHLELKHPHLIGHDFGAATVLGAHLVEKVDVASLIIIDGVVLSPWGTPFSRHVKEHQQVFAAVPEYIHNAMLSAHLNTGVSRQLSKKKLKLLLAPWQGEQGQQAYFRQVAQYDYEYTEILEKLYPNISVPTLILWGEEDRWVDISEARRLQDLIPTAAFQSLPDAGHFSMLDTPNNVSQSIKSWLDSAWF